MEEQKLWKCPICLDFFTQDKKREHIDLEVKELKETLEILKDL